MPSKTRKARNVRAQAPIDAARLDSYPSPPRTGEELRAWLRETLELRVPLRALVPGHAAPFDYLAHSFFEGRGRWLDGPAGADKPSAEESAGGPTDCIVWANRGGGKTFLGAVATMLDLVFKHGIEVRILAGSLEQASRMHAHLRNLFEKDALAPFVDGRITDRRIRLTNRSSAELLAQSQVSVRGTRIQKLRCDEVELFDPMVWDAAQLTTRPKRCGRLWVRGTIECLSTMHVPHGIMARLVDGCAITRGSARVMPGPRRRLFKWGLIDALATCGDEHQCHGKQRGIALPGDAVSPPSPVMSESVSTGPFGTASGGSPIPRDLALPILDPADCSLLPECGGAAKHNDDAGHITIEDALTQKSRVGAATWESEMLCLRPRRSDSVLPEFDAAVHIVKRLLWEPGEPAHWIGGMDFGFRNSVILWAGIDKHGAVCIADERCAENEIMDEHVRAIRAGLGRPWPALSWIGVDPAGEGANDQTGAGSAQVLRAAGLTVRARPMSILQGLSLIRARLKPADGPPRLFVHERCRRLVESLEKYHYRADRPESLTPVKDGHDHAVDALRYLMVNLDRPYRTQRGRYPD